MHRVVATTATIIIYVLAYLNLVSDLEVEEDCLSGHGVLVVGLVVLVVEGGHLVPVPAQRHQRLLHVVGAHVDQEAVGPGQRRSEDAGLRVHPPAKISVAV